MAGLNSAAEALGTRRNQAEALFLIEAGVEDGCPWDGSCERWFVLLGLSALRPKAQTYLRCQPWSVEMGGPFMLPAGERLPLPLTVRVQDRASSLSPPDLVLDAVTSNTLAVTLSKTAGALRICEVEYEVPRDPRLSIVTQLGEFHLIWRAGMRRAPQRQAPDEAHRLGRGAGWRP